MLAFSVHLVILCFSISSLCQNYAPQTMLCPSNYWPAKINMSGGLYGTDRTFTLPYQQVESAPICRYCPNVGCYIVRLRSSSASSSTVVMADDRQESESGTNAPLKFAPVITSAFENAKTVTNHNFSSLKMTQQATVLRNDSLLKDAYDLGNKSYEDQNFFIEQETLYMSCDRWDNLPSPRDIVSYLDCVMIGEESQYYLFIYEPRFGKQTLPAVDCVDAEFLAWIEVGTDLLGLELGFKMKSIPPYLFRYYQRIMQLTQYICIDGSSLTNSTIDFRDTERFASNRLTQVVFRTDSLKRDRQPPKSPDYHHIIDFQSDEEIQSCPFIVQHKAANITPNADCQFSPAALPTTSDKVSAIQALERCPFRQITKREEIKKQNELTTTDSVNDLDFPPSVLSACLLIVVLLLTIGIIITFCIINHEKLMLCKTGSRKRREREAALALELAEEAAKEAANAASEAQQSAFRYPMYGRYGTVPPTMGGAFGAFAPR